MSEKKHHLFQRECIKCGCPLAFVRSVTGAIIPLDLRAPVYGVVDVKLPSGDIRREAVRTELAFPSHFATCKFADEFKK